MRNAGFGITPNRAFYARGLYRQSGISPCPEDTFIQLFSLQLYQVASATASPKYVVLLLFFKEICFPQNKSSSFFIYVLLLNHHKTT